MRRAPRRLALLDGGPQGQLSPRPEPTVRGGATLEYQARIKVHDPCHAGVLVELAGEFDASCLVAFGQALKRASDLGGRTFVDLAGVTFMDARCLRKLASGRDAEAGPFVLCRPSWQFRLGVAACGMERSFEVLPDDDPGYEAVIAEVCGCERAGRTVRPKEHHLYVRASQKEGGAERGRTGMFTRGHRP